MIYSIFANMFAYFIIIIKTISKLLNLSWRYFFGYCCFASNLFVYLLLLQKLYFWLFIIYIQYLLPIDFEYNNVAFFFTLILYLLKLFFYLFLCLFTSSLSLILYNCFLFILIFSIYLFWYRIFEVLLLFYDYLYVFYSYIVFVIVLV